MNTLQEIQSELDIVLGFSEQVRLTTEKRTAAINQSLIILYGLLSDSPILKNSTTITLDSSEAVSPTQAIASPPSDFNDGTVLYMGDSSTWNNSSEVYEVDGQRYGRWDSEDYYVFTREYNADTNDLEFWFKGVASGTFYMEYIKAAPTLSNSTDVDGLPKATKHITAKLASGILIDNILSDTTRMQIFLYGASGNPSRYTPDSVYGLLQSVIKGRRIRKQTTRTTQITLT